jgi:hypothetical protein
MTREPGDLPGTAANTLSGVTAKEEDHDDPFDRFGHRFGYHC